MKNRICAKLCFVGLMFSYAIPAFGQYLNKTYELDSAAYGEWGFSILANNSTDLIIIGGGYEHGTNQIHSHSLLIANNGVKMSSNLYILDDGNTYNGTYGTAKLMRNGTIGTPITINHRSSIQPQYGSAYFGFLSISKTGVKTFFKGFADTSNFYDGSSDFIELENGNLILVGARSCIPQSCKASGFFIKTDSLGNTIWQKTITKVAGQGAIINSIQALGGDTLLVGADSYSSQHKTYRNQTQYYRKSDPWFILMDTAGNILYDTLLNVGFASMKRIMRDPLGGYFFWGQQDSFYAYSPLSSENLPGYIAHMDNNFKIDWIKTLAQTQGLRYVYMMKPLADGNLLAVGAQQKILAPGSFSMKLDRRTGNTIWFHGYGEVIASQSYLVDFVERPDKSLVMTGTYRDTSLPAWRQNDVWVVGVDSNGCEMPGCSFVGVPPAPLPPVAEFRVWPNPSAGDFNVESEERGILNVYSLEGRKVFTSTVAKGRQVFDMPIALPGGVYVLRYMPEGGVQVKTVKLVYQK